VLLFASMAAFALAEYRFRGNTLMGLYLALGIMIPIRLGTVSILRIMVASGLTDTLMVADPRLHRPGHPAGGLHPVGVHAPGAGRPEGRRPHRRRFPSTASTSADPAAGAPGARRRWRCSP
jgi:hypothetical protein